MSLTNEDKDWINAGLDCVETNLFTGFHKWAGPIEMGCEATRRPCVHSTWSGKPSWYA
jgi:hypothetical protein